MSQDTRIRTYKYYYIHILGYSETISVFDFIKRHEPRVILPYVICIEVVAFSQTNWGQKQLLIHIVEAGVYCSKWVKWPGILAVFVSSLHKFLCFVSLFSICIERLLMRSKTLAQLVELSEAMLNGSKLQNGSGSIHSEKMLGLLKKFMDLG